MKSEEILSIFKRRGVLWPSAEIYGGAQGLYDYGPVGLSVKRGLEKAWERWFLGLSNDYFQIEPSEIIPEAVVRASGHLDHFSDPLVTCERCGAKIRADALLEECGAKNAEALTSEDLAARMADLKVPCPHCGGGPLSSPRPFNLMFSVEFGPTGKERAYLRPETAQGSYLSFARMWNVGRKRLPLGIAVVGKAFRNEIAPRQGLFRMREFNQAELQIFFDPSQYPEEWKALDEKVRLPVLRARRRMEEGAIDPEETPLRELVELGELPPFYAWHLLQTYRFFRESLGYPKEKIRLLEKSEKERAFYNKIQFDVEVQLDSLGGFKEMGAVHYRGEYDLTRHSEGAKTDLGVTLENGRHLIPHVLELTFGMDRNLWALGELHLKEDGERRLWSLPPYLAPMTAGVLPLIPKKHRLLAKKVMEELKKESLPVVVDEAGSIGRRYARLDEIGVPFVITIDDESEGDQTFTLRERDTKAQRRAPLKDLLPIMRRASLPPQAKEE